VQKVFFFGGYFFDSHWCKFALIPRV